MKTKGDQVSTARRIILGLDREYKKNTNKDKAAWRKTMWTKNQYDFYGLPFPIRREKDEKVI